VHAPLAVVAAITAVALGAAGACTQIGSDPNEVVALAFDSLPYPAVVIGDTLRDETGATVALRAAALNADGDAIPDAPFTFLTIDTTAVITSGGLVVSTDTLPGQIRLIAQSANGLQSRQLTLQVTPRPDSIEQQGTVDTLRYVVPDGPQNTSNAITVNVLSVDSATPPASRPVRGWIVRYRVEYAGAPVAADNTTLAWLVDESNRRSTEDTTGTDGRASRRLRVVPTGLANAVDSLVVIATATRGGAPLAGSPVSVIVRVRAQ
jgi:hypothetical protein